MSTRHPITLQPGMIAVVVGLVAGVVLSIHPARVALPEPSCTITGTSGADTLIGTSGDDVICGLGGDDIIKGLGGADVLYGGPGADKLFGGPGDDTLDGGYGIDAAHFNDSAGGVTASLTTNTATGEGSDTFTSIENLTGSMRADFLEGSDSSNALSGRGGNDTLLGLGGDDKLTAGTGGDLVRGGAGDDSVTGNGGSDDLFGDEGYDTLDSKDGVKNNDVVDGGADQANCTTDATEKKIIGCKDTTAPTVTSVSPGGRKVSPRANVTATFSEPMDGDTITGTTFKLLRKNSTIAVPATVTYKANNQTATLDPKANLRRGVTYKATVAAEIADLAGNQIGATKTWSFTTKRR